MMAKKSPTTRLTFAEACEYLALAPDELVTLRELGLVACRHEEGRQIYPEEALRITQQLLKLAQRQVWTKDTLAWFADLSFAASIGRVLLVPIEMPDENSERLSTTWLETPNLSSTLSDFEITLDGLDEAFNNLLRSVVAVGEARFWSDVEELKNWAIYPLINHLEQKGIPILGQGDSIARDSSPILIGLVLTFTHVAPPISSELANIIEAIKPRVSGNSLLSDTVTSTDQAFIQKEGLVAIDRFYAGKIPEIHSQPAKWDLKDSALVAQRRTIQLVTKLPLDQDQEIIDNILDLIRPYVGPFGARVVHLLYEIANDAPNWRNPQIVVNTNDLLDRLGHKRSADGYHHSKNRERLRDVLNIAHSLEIVGEYPDWENGQRVTRAIRKTVLSLIGATYTPDERQGISTEELFQRGLPRSMVVRLNFYDGIRRPDGKLGNRYVLMPRLADPKVLPKANRVATSESLRTYLLIRYRQLQMKSLEIVVTRQIALEKANISTKNVTRATQILTHALEKLVQEETLTSFTDVPRKPQDSFTVVLSPTVVQKTRE
jgi:hypothetical protein